MKMLIELQFNFYENCAIDFGLICIVVFATVFQWYQWANKCLGGARILGWLWDLTLQKLLDSMSRETHMIKMM